MRFFVLLFSFITISSYAQAHKHGDGAQHEDVTIEKLSDNISMIQAGGGNIAVYETMDGVFVIDNGLSDKRDAVITALKSVTDKPIKYLVNTHWHFDHAGNNEHFGKSDTIILAHENVRERLQSGGEVKAFNATVKPQAKDALPVLTYEESIKLYLAEEAVHIQAVDPAHTDGDSFIVFTDQNIIHTGDLFFNGFWPFIDASSGGSITGMIQAVEMILAKADDTTKIIPGHGPVATKKDLQTYHDMLTEIEGRLKAAKRAEQTKEEWVKSAPLADLDGEWGQGFLLTPKFTDIVWDTL